MNKLLFSKDIYDFFKEKNYSLMNPFNIVNNNDTVFYSAGIQPLLQEYLNDRIDNNKKLFIAQPVIRTQYLDKLDEGTSLAFINSTTSEFNLSENEYNLLVNDWLDYFYQLGLKKQNISTACDYYEDNWNGMDLAGKRRFYYYDNIEIGDTTFFTKVDNSRIETMCDLGFGVERLRWCTNGDSYYNLYSDSSELPSEEKALISAISLLSVCNVKPSNKNSGYRARLFSKRLAKLLESRHLNNVKLQYLNECLDYWKDWQKEEGHIDNIDVLNEYERNCNSNTMNVLANEGYNVNKININLPWDEFKNRLKSAGVPKERIKSIKR